MLPGRWQLNILQSLETVKVSTVRVMSLYD